MRKRGCRTIGQGMMALLLPVLLGFSVLYAPTIAQAQNGGQCGCLDVVFVVDDTGSMAGAIANVKTGLTSIIAAAKSASGADSDPNQLRMGLISFADNPEVDQTLTTDVDGALSTAVGALSAGGGGGEPEASDESLNLAANGVTACAITNPPWSPLLGEDHPSGSDSCLKIAVLITDARPGGCDDAYADGVDDTNAANVATAAAGNGVIVSAVLVDDGSIASPAHPGGVEPDVMQGYATATGGSFVTVPSDGTGTANAIADIIENCGGEGKFNHYLGYTVRPIDGDDSIPVVRLTDQFGEGVFKVAKKSVVHYNPVDKNEEGISNPDVHQVGYDLLRTEGTDSPHTVDVTNQFGTITVTTANAERLLVPSTKTLGTSDGLPRELENGKLPEEVENHFLCYGLTSFDGFSPLEVTVADQFKDTRPFSVLRPIALCNPVTKEVQGEDGSFGEPEEPVNAKNHLLCYGGGVKTRDRFEPIRFETNNQLGFDFWEARRDAGVLCVPSEKKEGKEPFCGDGNLDPGEECDDGNNVDGDGCSATCEDEKVQ